MRLCSGCKRIYLGESKTNCLCSDCLERLVLIPLRDENARLIALLADCEWAGHVEELSTDIMAACPICGGTAAKWKPLLHGIFCPLGRALGRPECVESNDHGAQP